MNLPRATGGDAAQIFVLQYGLTTLTSASGAKTGVTSVHCVADGTLAVTFPNTTEAVSIAMVEGDQFGFASACTVEVSSGTFHMMA